MGQRFDTATQQMVDDGQPEPNEGGDGGSQGPPAPGGRAPLTAVGDNAQPQPQPGTPEPTPEPTPEAEAEAEAAASRRTELAGKRVIFVREVTAARSATNAEMWVLLVNEDGSPQLYEGDPDVARSAALEAEANAAIAEKARQEPGSLALAAPPASSWAPEPVKPRTVTTAWSFGGK